MNGNENKNKNGALWTVAVVGIILALVVGANSVFGFLKVGDEVPVARANVPIYMNQGATQFTVGSGGEIEVQSGGTLDLRPGSTANLSTDLSTTGTLTINALVVTTTVDASGAATFNSTVDIDGAISSGTGSITMTDNVNITGTVDADSTLNADGAVTFNSTVDIDGAISSGTGVVTITDGINVTGTADFDSTVNVDGLLNYGTNSLYPIGFGTASYAFDVGSYALVTDTQLVGLTNVTTATNCLVTMSTTPAATNAMCSCSISGGAATIACWESDYTAGTTGALVYYIVTGQE